MKKYSALILLAVAVLAPDIVHAEEPTNALAPGANLVYVIPIHGEINRAAMAHVKRGIAAARDAGAEVVIFDIDTFGGRVDSALSITSLIGGFEGRTAAYVTSDAERLGVSWSAGALIAFSCQDLYMAPGTSIGAAAPVFQTGEGMTAAPEKVVSALRSQMASLAERNGYPPAIAMAMVDMDLEVLEVHVNDEVKIITRGELPEIERLARIQDQEVEEGRIISPAGKLLTLSSFEADRLGVSSATVINMDELFEAMDISDPEVVVMHPTWADSLIALITSGGVTGLLIMIGIVALYMEVSSPGFGVPGTIAVLAFGTMLLTQNLLGHVGSLEIILLMVGMILLIIEVLLLPDFGVAGVLGLLMIFVALVLSQQGFTIPRLPWEWDAFYRNSMVVFITLTLSVITISVLAHYTNSLPGFRRLALSYEQSVELGYSVQAEEEAQTLVGKQGVTISMLRPVGKAEIGDEVLVVEADGEYIDVGTKVEVVKATGNHIVVRKC